MNVKSLIAELEKYDENLLVVVDGYEDGVTENFNLLQVKGTSKNPSHPQR